jgi:hypothetical protein
LGGREGKREGEEEEEKEVEECMNVAHMRMTRKVLMSDRIVKSRM